MQLRLVRDDADKTEDKAEVYEVESDDDQPVPPSKARRVQAASTSSTSPPVAFHRGELTHLRLKFPHTSAMRRLS